MTDPHCHPYARAKTRGTGQNLHRSSGDPNYVNCRCRVTEAQQSASDVGGKGPPAINRRHRHTQLPQQLEHVVHPTLIGPTRRLRQGREPFWRASAAAARPVKQEDQILTAQLDPAPDRARRALCHCRYCLC